GPRLLAGAAMRLLKRDRLPRLLLPGLDERGIELLVELTRRIVGDVQQRGLRAAGGGAKGEPSRGQKHQASTVHLRTPWVAGAGSRPSVSSSGEALRPGQPWRRKAALADG